MIVWLSSVQCKTGKLVVGRQGNHQSTGNYWWFPTIGCWVVSPPFSQVLLGVHWCQKSLHASNTHQQDKQPKDSEYWPSTWACSNHTDHVEMHIWTPIMIRVMALVRAYSRALEQPEIRETALEHLSVERSCDWLLLRMPQLTHLSPGRWDPYDKSHWDTVRTPGLDM